MSDNARLAILGGGVMGEALLAGVLSGGRFAPASVTITDSRADRLADLAARYGVSVTTSNVEAAAAAQTIFIAVKPHVVGPLLEEISSSIQSATLLMSIAAGITMDMLQTAVPSTVAVVRAMPNSPCRIGAGAIALVAGQAVTSQHKEFLTSLLSPVGRVAWINENLIDAVTGLSGSGPAYVFAFIEALADGGVRGGLPRDISLQLAAQTLLGAAQMMLSTGEHPAILREQVCTPGGTTIEGLHALEKGHFRATVAEAVEASLKKSQELARRFAEADKGR